MIIVVAVVHDSASQTVTWSRRSLPQNFCESAIVDVVVFVATSAQASSKNSKHSNKSSRSSY